MTTTAPATVAPAYRVTPYRVLRSEWHKLWTLRSTWINLAATAVLTLGMGAGISAAYDGSGEGGLDTVVFVLLGTQFATINLAVLGILATAGEYSTGQIRATMTAVPRRLPVLWSKAAVLAAVAFVLSLWTNLLTFPWPSPSSPTPTRRPPSATRASCAAWSATRPVSPSSPSWPSDSAPSPARSPSRPAPTSASS